MKPSRLVPALAAAAITLTVPGIAMAENEGPIAVSHDDDGHFWPGQSRNAVTSDGGTRVAYSTQDKDGWTVNVMNLTTGKNLLGQFAGRGNTPEIDLSGDGQKVAMQTHQAGDASPELWVHDITSGDSKKVPVDFAYIDKPRISTDGNRVAFTGEHVEGDPRQAYVWDVKENKVFEVTTGGGVSSTVISGDGNKVAYSAGGHSYVRTVATGSWMRADTLPAGQRIDGHSRPTALSDNGNYVLFESTAVMGAIPNNCSKNNGCLWRKHLSGDKSLTLGSQVGDVTTTVAAPTQLGQTSDLSGDGRVAVYSTSNGYARAYRFSTDKNVYVSRNSDSKGRRIYDVSADRTGNKVTYTTVDSTNSPEPTSWITASGV